MLRQLDHRPAAARPAGRPAAGRPRAGTDRWARIAGDTEPSAPGCAASWSCSRVLHCGAVLATARSPVAVGSMEQSLLGGGDIGCLASPDLQRGLLDGSGK